MSTNNILLSKTIDDCVYEITFNNPSKRNPLSLEVIELLQDLLDNLKSDKKIKIILLNLQEKVFVLDMT